MGAAEGAGEADAAGGGFTLAVSTLLFRLAAISARNDGLGEDVLGILGATGGDAGGAAGGAGGAMGGDGIFGFANNRSGSGGETQRAPQAALGAAQMAYLEAWEVVQVACWAALEAAQKACWEVWEAREPGASPGAERATLHSIAAAEDAICSLMPVQEAAAAAACFHWGVQYEVSAAMGVPLGQMVVAQVQEAVECPQEALS